MRLTTRPVGSISTLEFEESPADPTVLAAERSSENDPPTILGGHQRRQIRNLLNLKEEVFAVASREQAKSSKSIHEGEPLLFLNNFKASNWLTASLVSHFPITQTFREVFGFLRPLQLESMDCGSAR